MGTHKPIAVVAAMPLEMAPLVRSLPKRNVEGLDLYEMDAAVVVVGGIGENAARRACEVVIRYARPERLVNAGLAGGVSPSLKVGDVGRVREVVDVVSGVRYRTSGGEWVLATGATVSGPEGKKQLSAQYGADVVDMEGAAVAQAAHEHGLELDIIKSVSDVSDFVLPPLGKFVEPNGKFAMGRFLAYVGLRPRWWSAVNKLRRNSRLASMHLCSAVSHLMESSGRTSNVSGVTAGSGPAVT